MDTALRRAYDAGVVMCGMSAGALCWFEKAQSDYQGKLDPLDCLGFLPGACAVHYDGEPGRRPQLHSSLQAGHFDSVIAIDDCAAVLYENEVRSNVLSWRANAGAYEVCIKDGKVEEMPCSKIGLHL